MLHILQGVAHSRSRYEGVLLTRPIGGSYLSSFCSKVFGAQSELFVRQHKSDHGFLESQDPAKPEYY
jgi:hypothetical protein